MSNVQSIVKSLFSKASLKWLTLPVNDKTRWIDYSKSVEHSKTPRLSFMYSIVPVMLHYSLYHHFQFSIYKAPKVPGEIDLNGFTVIRSGSYSNKIIVKILCSYSIVEGDSWSRYGWFLISISKPYRKSTEHVSNRIPTSKMSANIVVGGSSKNTTFTNLVPNSAYFFRITFFRYIGGWQVKTNNWFRFETI